MANRTAASSHRRAFRTIACLAASWVAIEVLPLPFLLIFPLWFVYLTAEWMRGGGTTLRLVMFNLSFIVLALAIGEVVFAVKGEPGMLGESQSRMHHPLARTAEQSQGTRDVHEGRFDRYFHTDDRFGYAPAANDRVRARRYEDHDAVYDTVYNFDAHGLRVASPAADHDADADECLLFFGGSFAFGQGVADEETLPYRVGEKTGRRFRVYNFGFHGYGPHQMLYALDHGVVEGIVGCEPRLVVYLALHAHVKRAAGLTWWGRHGPRYVLDRQGEPVYTGHFDDEAGRRPPRRRSVAYDYLSRSRLFKELHRGTVVYGENVDLLVAIVDRSRRYVEDRWPGAEFHVVYWDKRFQLATLRLERALTERGLRMHPVSEILPDYFGNELRYQLSREDGHPNATAFEILAEHVAGLVNDGRDPASADPRLTSGTASP